MLISLGVKKQTALHMPLAFNVKAEVQLLLTTVVSISERALLVMYRWLGLIAFHKTPTV